MQRQTIETERGAFSALVWDNAATAPWLHFAHATGMHAGLYARLLTPLAEQFNLVASDARGHGRSRGGPVGERVEWEEFAADMLAIIAAVAPDQRWLLSGHSMGGSTSLLAAAQAPDRIAGLVLLDPPFIPFAMARAALAAGSISPNPMADQAARRRADFPDVATARAAWAGRGVFRCWSDADLDAYLADGLLPDGDGVTLACTPAWEAATFRGVTQHFESALAALSVPFVLLAGEHGSTVHAGEFGVMAAHPMCLSARRLPGTTHFLPLEAGGTVRDAVAAVANCA